MLTKKLKTVALTKHWRFVSTMTFVKHPQETGSRAGYRYPWSAYWVAGYRYHRARTHKKLKTVAIAKHGRSRSTVDAWQVSTWNLYSYFT